MEAISPDIVIRISEPALFTICFCIAMAALLAVLVLGCDKGRQFPREIGSHGRGPFTRLQEM